MSGNSANNRRRHPSKSTSRMEGIPERERGEHLVQNLDLSFMSIDSRGRIMPKTPEAAYMAANMYMMATRPVANDPRLALYQTAMAGIGMMGHEIANKGTTGRPDRSPRRHNSPRQGD